MYEFMHHYYDLQFCHVHYNYFNYHALQESIILYKHTLCVVIALHIYLLYLLSSQQLVLAMKPCKTELLRQFSAYKHLLNVG